MQSQHFTPLPPHFQSGCMIVGGVGEGCVLQCLLEYYCERMYHKFQVGCLSYSAKLHVVILCFLNPQPVVYDTCTHSESFLCQRKASSLICKGHVVMEEIFQKFIDDLYRGQNAIITPCTCTFLRFKFQSSGSVEIQPRKEWTDSLVTVASVEPPTAACGLLTHPQEVK